MGKDPVFPKCYVNVGDGAFIEAIPQPKDVIEKLEREIEELHSLLQKTGEHPNRQLTSAPALSAEQFSERDIEYWRRQLLLIEWSNPKTDHLHINTICDMALSSLTARDKFAKEKAALSQQWLDWGVKRRNEGIEAAAKAIDADESGRDSSGYFAELVRALKGGK